MLQAVLFFRIALWPAQVRHQHGTATVFQDFFDGGYGGFYPGFIRDFIVLIEGDIKIDSNQSRFIGEIEIINSFHG